jgi:hypothetical protein
MESEAPSFLIRGRDDKFSAFFDRVSKGARMRVIKTAVRAPDMNAVIERFLRSVRAEALDHVLVMDERHLDRVLRGVRGLLQPVQAAPRNRPAHPGRLGHADQADGENRRLTRARWPSQLSPGRLMSDDQSSQYGRFERITPPSFQARSETRRCPANYAIQQLLVART